MGELREVTQQLSFRAAPGQGAEHIPSAGRCASTCLWSLPVAGGGLRNRLRRFRHHDLAALLAAIA